MIFKILIISSKIKRFNFIENMRIGGIAPAKEDEWCIQVEML